jgi:hypothetical protein
MVTQGNQYYISRRSQSAGTSVSSLDKNRRATLCCRRRQGMTTGCSMHVGHRDRGRSAEGDSGELQAEVNRPNSLPSVERILSPAGPLEA